jgi:hypothetical protein
MDIWLQYLSFFGCGMDSGDADQVIPFIGTRINVDTISEKLHLETTVNYTAWYHDSQVNHVNINYNFLYTAVFFGLEQILLLGA